MKAILIQSLGVLALIATLVPATSSAKQVRTSGAMCTRGVTYAALMSETSKFLSDAEKKDLQSGKQVAKFVAQENGYEIGYVFSLTGYDAELIMGVFSSCDEHAGPNGLGGFIDKSKYVKSGDTNPFQVYYEQEGSWPYGGAKYTVENSMQTVNVRSGRGYILNSRLLDSSDASFSPSWLDAYFQATPHGKGSFVIACNYMVPRTGRWKGTFNDKASDRLKASGTNLLRWVTRIAPENEKTHAYRARLKKLLEQVPAKKQSNQIY